MNLTSFLQDKRLTIALKGEIDHHSAKDTMRVVGNKIDLYLPVVCVLDFREVGFMDSSGIAIVISAIRICGRSEERCCSGTFRRSR